mgnify:CR=1 FL=1
MPSLKPRKTPNLLLTRIMLLVFLDILVINLSAFLSLLIRFEFDFTLMIQSGGAFLDTLLVFAIPNTLLTLCLFWLFQLYSSLWGF